MPGCAAIGCNNRSEKGYMMKCFPRDPVLRQIWKEMVGRTDWEPSNNSFLCHMHFETNQWIISPNGRVKLKKGALPTVFNVTSTRKSSKKRGLSESDTGDIVDDYLIEYLQNDQTAPIELIPTKNLVLSTNSAQNDLKLEIDEDVCVLSNDSFDVETLLNKTNDVNANSQSKENNTENRSNIKREIDTEAEEKLCNDEYMQIEKRLKLVCDGEKYDDLINNHEMFSAEINERNLKKEKSPESSNETNVSEKVNDVTSSNNMKNKSSENCEQKSRFVIKISGTAEDIHEITKSMNANMNGIKMNNSQCNGSKFVTSEIVVDCTKLNDTTERNDFDDENVNTNSDILETKPGISEDCLFVQELLQKVKDLEAKIELQQQIINTLSKQSVSHKKITDSMKLFEVAMRRKENQIQQLRDKSMPKCLVDAQTEVDEPLLFKITTRNNQLEETNKQLMKSLNTEVDKRRKIEYQIRDRENTIKELKWKLEKASKFYERSEKNTNTYRRKLSTLQTLLRRRNSLADKKQIYDQLSAEKNQKSFTEKSLESATSILKACGNRGYTKLLTYNFPLPPLNLLLNKEQSVNKNVSIEDVDVSARTEESHDGLTNESKSTFGTVQDLFNECDLSDSDYTMDIEEFKRYLLTDDNLSWPSC